jgi:hypothetical protein
MNSPRWCSTTKIIVSFLNAELNATAVIVDRHLRRQERLRLAGWTTGDARLRVNAKAATCSGNGTIKVYGLPGHVVRRVFK